MKPCFIQLFHTLHVPGRWFLWSGSSVMTGGAGGVRLGTTPGLWWSPLSLAFISVWLADGEVLDGDIPRNIYE